MKYLGLALLVCLSGCSGPFFPSQGPDDQPNTVFESGDVAPEFVGVQWIGDSVDLASLDGKVVLLNFWSYDCGFCRQVIGWINEWYEEYHDQGLEVVGIHTPEFAYERKRARVADKSEEFGIQYPVGLDNDYQTWNAYHNKYRPAIYLIDREGKLQFLRYGTGYREETEGMIQELLR